MVRSGLLTLKLHRSQLKPLNVFVSKFRCARGNPYGLGADRKSYYGFDGVPYRRLSSYHRCRAIGYRSNDHERQCVGNPAYRDERKP